MLNLHAKWSTFISFCVCENRAATYNLHTFYLTDTLLWQSFGIVRSCTICQRYNIFVCTFRASNNDPLFTLAKNLASRYFSTRMVLKWTSDFHLWKTNICTGDWGLNNDLHLQICLRNPCVSSKNTLYIFHVTYRHEKTFLDLYLEIIICLRACIQVQTQRPEFTLLCETCTDIVSTVLSTVTTW